MFMSCHGLFNRTSNDELSLDILYDKSRILRMHHFVEVFLHEFLKFRFININQRFVACISYKICGNICFKTMCYVVRWYNGKLNFHD